MIRNAVLHLESEQPLMADLYRLPEAGDAGLLCTNLRLMNGSRPVFIDDIRSTFYFPWARIRFIEVTAAALAASGAGRPAEGSALVPAGPVADDGAGPGGPGPGPTATTPTATAAVGEADAPAPAPAAAGADPGSTATTEPVGPEGDSELELDEEFLRRIRDI